MRDHDRDRLTCLTLTAILKVMMNSYQWKNQLIPGQGQCHRPGGLGLIHGVGGPHLDYPDLGGLDTVLLHTGDPTLDALLLGAPGLDGPNPGDTDQVVLLLEARGLIGLHTGNPDHGNTLRGAHGHFGLHPGVLDQGAPLLGVLGLVGLHTDNPDQAVAPLLGPRSLVGLHPGGPDLAVPLLGSRGLASHHPGGTLLGRLLRAQGLADAPSVRVMNLEKMLKSSSCCVEVRNPMQLPNKMWWKPK